MGGLRFRTEIAKQHARFDERRRDRFADPRGSAGHNRFFAFQIVLHLQVPTAHLPRNRVLCSRDGITGVTMNLTMARWPKASSLTTEDSKSSSNFEIIPPIRAVFDTPIPTGTFHLFPALARRSQVIVGLKPTCQAFGRL